MITEPETLHPKLTVQIPPYPNPTTHTHSPFSIPTSNVINSEYDDVPVDPPACDHFRMYIFKIKRCARARSHDWIDCPYAHAGEKARRRDPRKFKYSGDPCPEFRNGTCYKGDTCEFAHGVFECWLHPSRYRTQPCKDGVKCHRKICFFAHTREQLRVNSVSQYECSPSRLSLDSVNELVCSVRNMQVGNTTRLMSMSPVNGSGLCSPRGVSKLPPGFASVPSTPTRNKSQSGANPIDEWDERMMERVESGKEIRAKIYAKLCRENSVVGRVNSLARRVDS